jgi:cell division cycle 20-like protein 1 (cofactor of APC complex)
MSGLKNSPFGKRLRATQQDPDEEGPRRSRPRTNPVFGVAPVSTPSLDSSRPSTSESGGPESPTEPHRQNKDYGDRFVPSRDAGDLRTSYNLMEESGPSTPSRNRSIPTESDATKGERSVPPLLPYPFVGPISTTKPVVPVLRCAVVYSFSSPIFYPHSSTPRYVSITLIGPQFLSSSGNDGPGRITVLMAM